MPQVKKLPVSSNFELWGFCIHCVNLSWQNLARKSEPMAYSRVANFTSIDSSLSSRKLLIWPSFNTGAVSLPCSMLTHFCDPTDMKHTIMVTCIISQTISHMYGVPAYAPGAWFIKYLMTILRLSYDNAKVTIDLRRTSLIDKTFLEGHKAFLRYDSLAKS